MCMVILITVPVGPLFALSALFAEPRVGKAELRLEQEALGTADMLILSWLAQRP